MRKSSDYSDVLKTLNFIAISVIIAIGLYNTQIVTSYTNIVV